ncbi:MAG: SDR family NAD(P)-dependent oxidoreductase, partial [Hymenobacter sp.]
MATSIISTTEHFTTGAPLAEPAAQPGLQVFSLAGRVALITGGGTGIGLEIARCMVAAGATVVITGRREAVLQASAAELGEGAHFLVNDITDLS